MTNLNFYTESTYKLHRVVKVEIAEGQTFSASDIFSFDTIVDFGPFHSGHSLGKGLLLFVVGVLSC